MLNSILHRKLCVLSVRSDQQPVSLSLDIVQPFVTTPFLTCGMAVPGSVACQALSLKFLFSFLSFFLFSFLFFFFSIQSCYQCIDRPTMERHTYRMFCCLVDKAAFECRKVYSFNTMHLYNVLMLFNKILLIPSAKGSIQRM